MLFPYRLVFFQALSISAIVSQCLSVLLFFLYVTFLEEGSGVRGAGGVQDLKKAIQGKVFIFSLKNLSILFNISSLYLSRLSPLVT